jgi:hypothetical protein
MGSQGRERPGEVVRFIEERIETVPHLEALLLVWEQSEGRFRPHEIAARLYVTPERAGAILEDLVNRQLLRPGEDEHGTYYQYDGAWDPGGKRMAQVAATYRRHLVQVATVIHSKASTAVHDFARAFRIKKE